MKAKYDIRIAEKLARIDEIARDLPAGKQRAVYNLTSQIGLLADKQSKFTGMAACRVIVKGTAQRTAVIVDALKAGEILTTAKANRMLGSVDGGRYIRFAKKEIPVKSEWAAGSEPRHKVYWYDGAR